MLNSIFFPKLDLLSLTFLLGKNGELSYVYFCKTYLVEIFSSQIMATSEVLGELGTFLFAKFGIVFIIFVVHL
jgi:hypothetical protein